MAQGLVSREPSVGGSARRGTNGVSTSGVTANFMFFDRGTFSVLLLTNFDIPKSARAYQFPKSVKIHYFCSGPISVDPICPQPTNAPVGARARFVINGNDDNECVIVYEYIALVLICLY